MKSTPVKLPAPSLRATPRESILFGAIFGLVAAVGYVSANICLRAVSECEPVWVSCMKSLPTIALFAPWLIVLAFRRVPILPPWKAALAIVVTGAIGQFGGNVGFQWSLGVIGIALAVPLCTGAMILSGAVMGRMLLQERITPRTVFAIALLLVAIFVLSLGAGDAYRSVVSTPDTISTLTMVLGLAAAIGSGIAYAVLGIAIKYAVRGGAPISSILVIVALVGAVGLGSLSWARIGWDGILATAPDDLGVMVLAGICNAVAFAALTKALQLTTVTLVNTLNASQAAMAAVAGVVIFQEAPTWAMAVGVALTMVGLVLIKGRSVSDGHSRQADLVKPMTNDSDLLPENSADSDARVAMAAERRS